MGSVVVEGVLGQPEHCTDSCDAEILGGTLQGFNELSRV